MFFGKVIKMKNETSFTHYMLLLFGIGLVIVALMLAYQPLSGTGQQNQISVSGTAEKKVMPDEAELYVAVQTEGLTAGDVQSANTIKSDKIVAGLIAAGIPKDKIETTQYNLYPKYNYIEETGESKIIGYTLTHVLKVTTEDIQNVGKYSDSAIDAGANQVQSINFKLKTETEKAIREELLSKAANDARGKAEAIATGLGSKIGKVISVSEGQVYFPIMYARGLEAKAMDSSAPTAAPTDILPTQATVTASVQVAYEVK